MGQLVLSLFSRACPFRELQLTKDSPFRNPRGRLLPSHICYLRGSWVTSRPPWVWVYSSVKAIKLPRWPSAHSEDKAEFIGERGTNAIFKTLVSCIARVPLLGPLLTSPGSQQPSPSHPVCAVPGVEGWHALLCGQPPCSSCPAPTVF